MQPEYRVREVGGGWSEWRPAKVETVANKLRQRWSWPIPIIAIPIILAYQFGKFAIQWWLFLARERLNDRRRQ